MSFKIINSNIITIEIKTLNQAGTAVTKLETFFKSNYLFAITGKVTSSHRNNAIC